MTTTMTAPPMIQRHLLRFCPARSPDVIALLTSHPCASVCPAALFAKRPQQYAGCDEALGLFHHAVIHDDEQASLLCSPGGLRMTQAFLHPDGLGANADGLIYNVRHGLGAPENVHHIDGSGIDKRSA